MNMLQDIYGCYRKAAAWNNIKIEILKGNLNDEQAQAAIRGHGATKDNLLNLAFEDIGEFFAKNREAIKQKIKLQLRAECDEVGSYLIWLNFIIEE
jgi:hypothetical protein